VTKMHQEIDDDDLDSIIPKSSKDITRCIEQISMLHEAVDEIRRCVLLKGGYDIPKLVDQFAELKADVDALWRRVDPSKVKRQDERDLVTEATLLAARLALAIAQKDKDEAGDLKYVAEELKELCEQLEA